MIKDELGMIKEVASIASGHGSIALSELLGKRINLEVPSIRAIVPSEISSSIKFDQMGIGAFCKVLSGMKGQVAYILDEKNAYRLIDMSCKIREDEKLGSVLTEMGLSLIKEIGNVVICAYLNAISLITKQVIIPSIPMLVSGSFDDIMNIVLIPFSTPELKDATCYLIEAEFSEPEEKLKGSFYLVLSPDAFVDIQIACHKLLKDINEG